MTHPNQDLIDAMDAEGARFTVRANEPEAIAETVAGWLYTVGRGDDVSNINVLDSGDVIAGAKQLSDAELIATMRYGLANHT